jgi:hypothetical protein
MLFLLHQVILVDLFEELLDLIGYRFAVIALEVQNPPDRWMLKNLMG